MSLYRITAVPADSTPSSGCERRVNRSTGTAYDIPLRCLGVSHFAEVSTTTTTTTFLPEEVEDSSLQGSIADYVEYCCEHCDGAEPKVEFPSPLPTHYDEDDLRKRIPEGLMAIADTMLGVHEPGDTFCGLVSTLKHCERLNLPALKRICSARFVLSMRGKSKTEIHNVLGQSGLSLHKSAEARFIEACQQKGEE